MAKRKRIVVGRNDGQGRRRWFRTMREAVAYLGTRPDQTAVEAGAYYLDAPEAVINPRRKRKD